MTYNVLMGTLNPTHSLTKSLVKASAVAGVKDLTKPSSVPTKTDSSSDATKICVDHRCHQVEHLEMRFMNGY